MSAVTDTVGVLLLHPDDNVLVVARSLRPGDHVTIAGKSVEIGEAISVGHKIARMDMAVGATIVRYGAPIGSLVSTVKRGDHIHSHNLKSDYIPSHDRQATELKG